MLEWLRSFLGSTLDSEAWLGECLNNYVCKVSKSYTGVSKNRGGPGPPKSLISIGFSIMKFINHPFRGTPIFGNIHTILESGMFRLHLDSLVSFPSYGMKGGCFESTLPK